MCGNGKAAQRRPAVPAGFSQSFSFSPWGFPFVEPFHSQGRVLPAAWPPNPYTVRPRLDGLRPGAVVEIESSEFIKGGNENKMIRQAKRTLSLLLVLALSMSLCMLPVSAIADDADTIQIKVRVFDTKSGKAYEVGSDKAVKADSGIQSKPYTIPELSYFTKGTCDRVLSVVGNWYFPVSDRAPGSIVYFSNNASTATITYWVEGYQPPTTEQPKPGGSEPSVTPPEVTEGEVALTVKVVYVDYKDQVVGFGDGKALKLKCQSTYCKHNVNCSILLKDFHPTTLGIGEEITADNGLTYKWIGWSKYTADAEPQFGTFYDWKKDTTNVATPKSATFYLIYKNSDAPSGGSEAEIDTSKMTVNGDDEWTYLDAMYIMDFLNGTIQLGPEAQLAADYNHDGELSYLDAMAIMDDLAGNG